MNARQRRQKGAASVEFALGVALILTPLLLGMVDFGRYLSVGHTLSRAAHEGAFSASRGADPTSVVQNYVTQAGLDAGKLTLTVTPALNTATRGDAMKLTVKYDLAGYALAVWGSLFPQDVIAVATARHE